MPFGRLVTTRSLNRWMLIRMLSPACDVTRLFRVGDSRRSDRLLRKAVTEIVVSDRTFCGSKCSREQGAAELFSVSLDGGVDLTAPNLES
jgi:hypothetical protein